MPHPPAQRPGKRRGLHWWDLLLAVPILALILPGTYARQDPTLFGFPFFYWYQFAWIGGGAAFTAIVFVLEKRARRRR